LRKAPSETAATPAPVIAPAARENKRIFRKLTILHKRTSP
jgi:hypothetical protein